jgi:hypothetical protein
MAWNTIARHSFGFLLLWLEILMRYCPLYIATFARMAPREGTEARPYRLSGPEIISKGAFATEHGGSEGDAESRGEARWRGVCGERTCDGRVMLIASMVAGVSGDLSWEPFVAGAGRSWSSIHIWFTYQSFALRRLFLSNSYLPFVFSSCSCSISNRTGSQTVIHVVDRLRMVEIPPADICISSTCLVQFCINSIDRSTFTPVVLKDAKTTLLQQ